MTKDIFKASIGSAKFSPEAGMILQPVNCELQGKLTLYSQDSLDSMALAGTRTSLSSALPKPKYSGEDEELPAQQRGPRVVDSRELESSQLVVKRAGPPPYGQRSGWRPRSAEDFGDGGAFPEIAVAQYPLDMGELSVFVREAHNELARTFTDSLPLLIQDEKADRRVRMRWPCRSMEKAR